MRTLVRRDARDDAEQGFELRWQPQRPVPCRPTYNRAGLDSGVSGHVRRRPDHP
jgi:hypothetical protein